MCDRRSEKQTRAGSDKSLRSSRIVIRLPCERPHENFDNLYDIYLNSQDIYVIFGGFITVTIELLEITLAAS